MKLQTPLPICAPELSDKSPKDLEDEQLIKLAVDKLLGQFEFEGRACSSVCLI